MRVFSHDNMGFILWSAVSFSDLEDETFVIITPFGYFSDGMFSDNWSFFYKVDSFRFEEKFKSVFGGDGKCQSKRALWANLKELVLDCEKVEMVFVQVSQVIDNTLSKGVLIIQFVHPERETTFHIVIGLIGQFYFLYTGSQHTHLFQLQSDPPHWVIKVTLCKVEFNCFFIIIRTLKRKLHFYHYRKVRRRHSWLLILFFS